MIPSITRLAKGTARFVRYENGSLWYGINLEYIGPISEWVETFEFPIPIEDSGSGAFTPEMKGISLMRWIRKEIDRLETEERTNERLKSEWVQKLAENGGAEG